MTRRSGRVTDRRAFLRGSVAAGGLAALVRAVPPGRWEEVTHPGRDAPVFLTADELATLVAVTDRLLPGPPEDPDPGAVEAGCAQAIDALLGAFRFDPPLVYAGGPWSNRAGGTVDHMAHFVPLDALQELAWRIVLEGSQGRPEREFAGPVTGLQQVYRQGLANLDRLTATTAGIPFRSAPTTIQEPAMRDPSAQAFVTQALSDTVAAMYGPPEYGGNRGLVGWKATRWPGDVQPRGYTDEEVREPDPDRRPLPYSRDEAAALVQQILPGFVISR